MIVLLVIEPVQAGTRSITVKNNCPEKISIGVLTNGKANPDQRFDLTPQGTRTISEPDTWGGRLFGQPECVGAGNNGPHCGNAGASNPATLAEFFFKGANGADYYDISLVDGYNIPASISPQGKGGSGKDCGTSNCQKLPNCPPNLAIKDGSGKVIGCQSSCSKTGNPQDCCVGQYDGPDKCKPDKQADNVKSACPDSYSFAYDDQTSTFSCSNPTGYTLTFC
ncbi:thaumatin [Halteromyces radiatus]|uniref:thaumatin n=1 Tax=Halteromyces radiatus TaxID=101107 RepID=UPI00221F8CE7|nr:thaumatin [Halteromyces radiatus]KAI8081423.1 thaumatin [Halteromyces radiatus]